MSDQARLDYVYRSLRAIADRGRAGLGDSYPEILSLCITVRDMILVDAGPMRFGSSSILSDRALLRLWDAMPDEDVGPWERALAFAHLVREADAKLAATRPSAQRTQSISDYADGLEGLTAEARELNGLMLAVWACAKPHPDVPAEKLRDLLGQCLPHIRKAALERASAERAPSAAPGDGQGAVADEIALVKSVLRGYPQSFARGDALRAVEKIEMALAAPGAAIAAREQEPDATPADFGAWLLGSYKGHTINASTIGRAIAEYNDECDASPAAAPTSQPNAAAQEQQAGVDPVVSAALSHADEMGCYSFVKPVPNTTPALYVLFGDGPSCLALLRCMGYVTEGTAANEGGGL